MAENLSTGMVTRIERAWLHRHDAENHDGGEDCCCQPLLVFESISTQSEPLLVKPDERDGRLDQIREVVGLGAEAPKG